MFRINKLQLKARMNYSSFQNPPSYFAHDSEPPKTLDQIRNHQQSQLSNSLATPHSTSALTSPHSNALVPSALMSPNSPPPSSFDRSANFNGYKDFSMSLAYIGIGSAVIYFLFDQHERLDESERQMKLMKKNQKELVIQMQNYKKKINKAAIDSTKKDIIIQGKMQMHIALLRQQLIETGLDPVNIDKALDTFEEEVKMEMTPTSVDLWVPGESQLKSLIPDPHEYTKKR